MKAGEETEVQIFPRFKMVGKNLEHVPGIQQEPDLNPGRQNITTGYFKSILN